MAHTIQERPNRFCFSKNEIRYIYLVDTLSRAGLYFEVKLVIGGVPIILPPLKPNSDGLVIVYIQQYIDAALQYYMPTGVTFANAASQYVNFYVETREVEDANLNPAYTTTENAKQRTAIKAGIERNRYGRNNFFVNYVDVYLPWLTWQPSGRMVALNEPQYLTGLFRLGSSDKMHLKTTWVCTDGTTGDIDTTLSVQSGYVFHFKTDAASLGVIAAIGTRTLYYYEVYIDYHNFVSGTVDISRVVNPYRYYIDYTHRYNTFDFIYCNSLGGIDTVRAIGEMALSIERNFEEVEGGFNANDWNTLVKGHESFYTAITQRRTYKGDIGFRYTKAQQDALVELLLSQYIYQQIDGRLVPVLSISKSQALGKTTDKLQSFPIEWQLSETNEVFTPQNILLGQGSDTETYP